MEGDTVWFRKVLGRAVTFLGFSLLIIIIDNIYGGNKKRIIYLISSSATVLGNNEGLGSGDLDLHGLVDVTLFGVLLQKLHDRQLVLDHLIGREPLLFQVQEQLLASDSPTVIPIDIEGDCEQVLVFEVLLQRHLLQQRGVLAHQVVYAPQGLLVGSVVVGGGGGEGLAEHLIEVLEADGLFEGPEISLQLLL